VADETKKFGAVTLNSSVHAYGAAALGGTRFQVSVAQSQAASADLDGSPLSTVTSAYKYDTFGNATEIVVSATDGHAKTTMASGAADTCLRGWRHHTARATASRARHGCAYCV
jgi:hypothetical protein